MPPFDLAAYRRRIGDSGPIAPDAATLRRLHRNHLLAVPFENLDVVRGIPVSLDPLAVYEKIVERRRGGWCFEMNNVFAQALRAVGFDVAHLGASVGEDAEREGLFNHLTLLARCDEGEFFADVGFATGPLEPLTFEAGETTIGPFT